MAETAPTRPRVDLYYEDIVVGEELETASHKVTKSDILSFAQITRDRHPLHTDEDFCRNTSFGRTIAHGLYGLSLMEGLKTELGLYAHTSLASLGWNNVRFLKPVFPDDTVRVKVKFVAKRESKKPDRGVVTEIVTLINHTDEVVTQAEHVSLLMRRPRA
ncbi:MAG: MaoC family dehydratase [Pseudomonadota bacterium]